MAVLRQSAAYTRLFLLVQSADHITGLTAATPTVQLSKAGAGFAGAAGTVTEIGSGWYKIALTSGDTANIGELAYHITAASADPTDFVDQITTFGLDIFPANFSILNIDSTGSVAVQSNVKKNQACPGFTFTMINATTKEPQSALSVTATRRQDAGAELLCDNTVVELANGIYKIDLTANDQNANKITYRFQGAGADDTVIELVTVP
jgi:hypothetical protein